MNREEALAHFETTYVRPMSLAQLRALAEEYRVRRDELARSFVAVFREVCVKAGGMQASGEKAPLAYITCALLRTALADGLPSHRISAQDGSWYLDPVECKVKYDASWAFCYLDALGMELEAQRRQYLNLIVAPDIDGIKRREAGRFNQFVVALARYAMPHAVASPEFRALARVAEFEVRVGEYRDWTEAVYKEARRMRRMQEPSRGVAGSF